MSEDTIMRNEFAESDAERIKALESERDKLLALLATERDKFGKRETEIMAERDKLKAEVEDGDEVIDELRAQNLRIAKEAVNFKNLAEKMARWLIGLVSLAEESFIVNQLGGQHITKVEHGRLRIDEIKRDLAAYESALKEGL